MAISRRLMAMVPCAVGVLVLCLLSSLGKAEAEPSKTEDRNHPSRKAVELTGRDGLPNFFAKAKPGAKLKVAYFGGSITAAEGWRPQTMDWFKKRYPETEWSEINAAIGGTGSDLGVYRLQRDVLDYHPDLVFVEFAVNDGGAAPAQIYACMEGIVRQIWKADPLTDICFVYTLHEGMMSEMGAGRLPQSASAMEWIADHYGIPSIEMALESARLIQSGQWVFTAPKSEIPADEAKGTPALKAFAPDGCHPFADTGHYMYTEAIKRSFAAMEHMGKAGAHKLQAPFAADQHENAKMVLLNSTLMKEGWHQVDLKTDPIGRNFADRLPILWMAETAGTTLHFKFRGRAAFVYDLLGPDGGELEITVDGRPSFSTRRFDAYCTYHRLGSTQLVSESESKDHEVMVHLTGKRFDKVEILKKNGNTMDDAARYEPLRWYAGALLLDGELLPIP